MELKGEVWKSVSEAISIKKREKNTKKRTGDYFHDKLKDAEELNKKRIRENSEKSYKYTALNSREKAYVYKSIINRQRVSCFSCMSSDMVNTNQNKGDYKIWLCNECNQILGLSIHGNDIDSIEMFNFGKK